MLLAPLVLSLLPAPTAALQEADDPVTGTWELVLTGDVEGVPPEGLSLVLGLERQDELEVRASLEMDRTRSDGIEAEYDEETGELFFQANHMGLLIEVELVLDGDACTGTFSGLGATVDANGKRVSRALPPPPEPQHTEPVDAGKLTPADWRADLRVLAERLPALHENAFHSVTAEEWARRVDELDARLATLDTRGSAIALAQLVALVGDAHTELAWRNLPLWSGLRIQLRSFTDGVFVTAVDEAFGDMLGARVVRIGALSVEEAMDRAATTFAAENDSWRREKLPNYLVVPELLVALGVATDAAAVPFTLESSPGETFEVVARPGTNGSILGAPDPAVDELPLWLHRTRETYWFQALPDSKAVYFAFNKCAEDPRQPMSAFVERLLAEVTTKDAQRLVIDLRHNAGGNSTVLSRYLPDLFAHPNLQAPGAIVALIGPRTYSSGMMNAEQLRQAGGVLLGEPTGGKPNSYGEVRSFRLPRTGLSVYYSTKLFRMLDDDPPSVLPDEEVGLTSTDWLGGHDPVLERALER